LPIKLANNPFIQKVITPLLFRGESRLLDELPHSDRCDSENFSSLLGRNQAHPQAGITYPIHKVNR
jgi:hypothetical protein